MRFHTNWIHFSLTALAQTRNRYFVLMIDQVQGGLILAPRAPIVGLAGARLAAGKPRRLGG